MTELINSFSDSSPCSQIKNISSLYLQQTFGFFLTLFKIFSSKAAITSTAYGGANFVPIAVPRICKFYQKIQKWFSLIQVQQVLSKRLLWPAYQTYDLKNPLEKQGLHHVGYLDKGQQHQ